jgi:S-DNA-T family DNA segregation ATPase FtsK/SpoIIIE
MIFEVLSSTLMGGVLGYTFIYQNGLGGNDAKKIENIATNCGLVAKDGKKIRIHRRTRKKGYTEYVFQMPQGLSLKDFISKIDHFQDGLNIKSIVPDLSLSDFKNLNWKGNVVLQIKSILEKKMKLTKEVEIEFDGMLQFKIYNQQLTSMLLLDESMLRGLKGWEVPIGASRSSNNIKHDFDKIAHMIIAGTTDFGKSNILKVIITTLIQRKPEEATFTLIDLKGGLSFNRFRNCKQVENVAKNPKEALETLKGVQERMDSTMNYLEENGFEDIKEAGMKERHFIVIDEAADIADDVNCTDILKDIARRGRAAGYRLLYATQYPTTETVPSQVKRNCIGRLCFVLDTDIASRAVLDEGGADKLPLIQGRAIYKAHGKHTVQTPYIQNEYIKKSIEPHINIRPRKEGDNPNEQGFGGKGKERGSNTLIIEETRLS